MSSAITIVSNLKSLFSKVDSEQTVATANIEDLCIRCNQLGVVWGEETFYFRTSLILLKFLLQSLEKPANLES